MCMSSVASSRARLGSAGRFRVDPNQAADIARTFKALSDPTRVRLVTAILGEERCVHDLCEALELEQSAASHQLRILRDQRLVKNRRKGRHVFYSLDDEHVRKVLELALAHVLHEGAAR